MRRHARSVAHRVIFLTLVQTAELLRPVAQPGAIGQTSDRQRRGANVKVLRATLAKCARQMGAWQRRAVVTDWRRGRRRAAARGLFGAAADTRRQTRRNTAGRAA